ncbi:hypothetical protein [Brevibacillus centrosporus]|uniref:hypothetical protein n=1 Tax=Brevibacillus centrosporus TaxID=54910 RepID=UPI003B01732E
MILNEELIRAFIKDFGFNQLGYMKGISISVEPYVHYEPQTVVEIPFIIKHDEQYLEITIRFVDAAEVQFNFASSLVRISLEIVDISGDGWERKDYLVRDLENEEDFHFYCNRIEVASVKLAEYVHPNW